MLKLGYTSVAEVPESLRELCKVEDGSVLLDDSKLKTAQDVQRALDARDHEKNDHKATRDKLAPWLKLGKTPEEVQEILDEYPSLKDGGHSNEDYLKEKKAHAAATRELETLKTQLAEAQKKVGELQNYKDAALRQDKWKEIRERLGKKYDADKLDMLYEDIEDKLQLDDIGEFTKYKGKSVEEYFSNRAELMGWAIKNTPGQSKPGIDKLPQNIAGGASAPSDGSLLDDEEKSLLDK